MISRQNTYVNTELNSNWEIYTSGQTEPLWFKDIRHPLKFNKLSKNVTVDVAIVGGGIAGITSAYLLSRSGKDVAILDDGYIGSGETSRTTAPITHALDDRYYNIEKKHGPKSARIAAESHTAAINFIETTVKKEGIDCHFKRLNGYLFLDSSDKESSLNQELHALKNAGILSANIEYQSPLACSDISPCICFQNQAQFQPMLYLRALANSMSNLNGVKVYTETHAKQISNKNTANVIKTDDGHTITAQHIILATNAPIVDKVSKIYDKQVAYRTYVIAAQIQKDSIPLALYWDTGNQKSKDHVKPYHYVRIQRAKNNDYDLLVVGREDHKTGTPNETNDFDGKFKKLERWMRKIFCIREPVVYWWSGQVQEP